jgi:hypothetical protein
MINSIVTDFRKSVAFSKADEVALFRALAASIVKHSSSTFVDETHGGNVCNVSFTSATGKTETCEIADLLIVSSEPSHSNLRATFWQAKKQAVSKWLNVTSSGSQLDFKGQFNQWDLLSRRPAVSGVASFMPPPDLLSSFHSSSIGSFGVFYEKNSATEVAHSIAEFLACPSPAAKHPTLSINGYLDKYYFSQAEAITRSDLPTFLSALFAFRVGALLDPLHMSHRWLVSWVRSKAVANAAPDALRSLNNFLGDEMPADNGDSNISSGLSILIVGTLNGA